MPYKDISQTRSTKYDNDTSCCALLNEVESHEEIPSIEKIYRLVQELTVKVVKLENENKKLKQSVLKKQKINILDCLNQMSIVNQPEIVYNEWLDAVLLSHVKENLNNVFKEDLIVGIVNTWKNAITATSSILPIKTYINRPNIFYIYVEDDNKRQWKQLAIYDMDRQLRRISQQFVLEFKKEWFIPNEYKIDNDEKWTNMYVDYYKRILGGSQITTEVICQRVRNQIYKLMKEDFENIVE
jgi:hypothetical protein|tara:strand:- start:49 stop:771 length:723 start_codon:yes stop_codon:yes gene_type:complete